MSSKNLKVFKIEFVTIVKTLHFNVKFPCQVKMIWKRSNQSAETTPTILSNGKVEFNQTLKLNVNMYFDTTTNKFVEKKCLYSFLIITDKGQKSAGSVTYDLAEFFNKRVYEIETEFPLDKCPVAGTKIDMKIYYEESKESGYDSMSCISSSSQLDLSTASMDISELQDSKSDISTSKQSQTDKSQKSAKSEKQIKVDTAPFDALKETDVDDYQIDKENPNKIGENIKSINSITLKINDFVSKCSSNIKFELQGYKRKNNTLEDQIKLCKAQQQKLQTQLSQERKKLMDVTTNFQNYKDQTENKIKVQQKKVAELENKSQSSSKLISQLEQNINQKGQTSSNYIQQLKSNHEQVEKKLKLEIEESQANLIKEKKEKNQIKTQLQQFQRKLAELSSKYDKVVEKNTSMENQLRNREKQLQETRMNLEKAYEHLVDSLNNII